MQIINLLTLTHPIPWSLSMPLKTLEQLKFSFYTLENIITPQAFFQYPWKHNNTSSFLSIPLKIL